MDLNSCEALLCSAVAPGSSLILVGGDDALAASLSGHGCAVDRVEPGEPAPGPARTAQVVVVASGVLAADAPVERLAQAGQWLEPGGRMVVVFENAAHADRRLAVLTGRRVDEPASPDGSSGLDLDTRDHALDVVARSGFTTTQVLATVVDPAPAAEVPAVLSAWVRHQPEAFEATFVVVAVAGEPAAVPPLTTWAVESAAAERWDAMPELDGLEAAVSEVARLRRSLLTMRDHQIAVEVETVNLRRLVKENAELRHDLKVLRQSATWKAGRLLVSPFAGVKRVLRGRAK